MIATVKATGFTYNVTGFSDDGSIKLEDGNWYSMEELEIGEGYDWQQVRIQASIAIIQGWASTPQGLTKNCMKGAVELADELIKELQKKGE